MIFSRYIQRQESRHQKEQLYPHWSACFLSPLIAVISLAVPEVPFSVTLGPVISAAALALMVMTYIKVYKRQTGEELDIQVFKEDLSYVDEKYQRAGQEEEENSNG